MILDNLLKCLIERRKYLNNLNFSAEYKSNLRYRIDGTMCDVNEIIFRGNITGVNIQLYRPDIEFKKNNLNKEYLTFVKIDGNEVGLWEDIKTNLTEAIRNNATIDTVLLRNIEELLNQ